MSCETWTASRTLRLWEEESQSSLSSVELFGEQSSAAHVGNETATKTSNRSNGTLNLIHNRLSTIDNQILVTTQGIQEQMTSAGFNRIGDEICLKKVKFSFMIEMPLIMSQVTYRIILVKK